MSALSVELPAAATPPPIADAGNTRLALAALAGIAGIALLITRWKVHAFLALTAAGLVAPLAEGMSSTHTALLVLSVGAGPLFFSHVNDAGFRLVKEYFGMDVPQTLKTWSVMETVISVVALGFVMLLSLVM